MYRLNCSLAVQLDETQTVIAAFNSAFKHMHVVFVRLHEDAVVNSAIQSNYSDEY